MFTNKNVSKEQTLKAIEQLEKNPKDKVRILTDIGIGAVGAAGAGYAASILGASAIFFGLIPVAAPLAVVAGGAALGGLALVGVKRVLFDGTAAGGRQEEMLKQLKERLREVESKERASGLGDNDKTKFHIFLKEPIKLDLISPQDAQHLISAVESGQMTIKEAYQLIEKIISSAKN